MKITNITKQKRNPERVSIYIDHKYSFSLTLNELLSTKLKINQEIDESRVEELKKISSDGKLKVRVIEWLFIRPRSRYELSQYLKMKKVEQELIEAIIRDMERLNYQSDTEFSRWWVDQRRSMLKSKRQIVYELKQKKVNATIIDDVTADYDDSIILDQLVTKKNLLHKYKDKQKFTQHVVQKGFSYELVRGYYDSLN